MLEPRTRNLQGAEQGAQRAAAVGLERERCPAIRARRARVEKGVNLLLEKVALEGDDIGDGLFMTFIVTRLLLDSRGVDLPMSYDPIVVTLSSLKPFFFNGLKIELTIYVLTLLGPSEGVPTSLRSARS